MIEAFKTGFTEALPFVLWLIPIGIGGVFLFDLYRTNKAYQKLEKDVIDLKLSLVHNYRAPNKGATTEDVIVVIATLKEMQQSLLNIEKSLGFRRRKKL